MGTARPAKERTVLSRVTVLRVIGSSRESQQLYLAQQEKTCICGLVVIFSPSFPTRGQLCVISQPSAKR